MADIHALALLAISGKLKTNPLSNRDQDLYLELLQLFKTLVFSTGSHNTMFADVIAKPFTTTGFFNYIMKRIPRDMKKKMGDIKNQSTNPKFWGPVLWKFLHWFSAAYLPSQKQSFVRFLQVIASTLPCKECSKHFTSILRRKNAVLARDAVTNANQFANYMILLHTMVNNNTNKITGATYIRVPASHKSKQSIRTFLKHRKYYSYSSDWYGRRSPTAIIDLNKQLKKNSPVKAPASSCGCGA